MSRKAIHVAVLFAIMFVWILSAPQTVLAAEKAVQMTVPECSA